MLHFSIAIMWLKPPLKRVGMNEQIIKILMIAYSNKRKKLFFNFPFGTMMRYEL